ncbi:MAG: transcriptional regulator [Pirellulaceae bacterium]|nr:MAG: transcriptional regulator [Pirellulaceae bacterium]
MWNRVASVAIIFFGIGMAWGKAADSAKIGVVAEKPAEGPYVEVDGGFMVPYTLVVPGTEVKIEMVPIPGGVFLLGSPEDEAGREEDEGPQVEVEVGPMWVSKYETTWRQYRLYMSMYKLFKTLQSQQLRVVTDSNKADAVTAPTELYDPSFTFEFGQDPELPAVTMTQFAAKQYTKWLSLLTGHQYRLPTEAEWEYACRAGAKTAYCFGDDPALLGEYAWYYDNSDEMPHLVGQKRPNGFGLYDMHGNVMEWVIDGYTEEGYTALAKRGKRLSVWEAIQWPTSSDQRVIRGGSFQDDPERLRCAARMGSEDEDWKAEDPNIPLSPWWFTDDPARGIGFRVVRSYQVLDDELIKKFWEIDHEDIELDVQMRLDEGRGVLSPVDPTLADQIRNSGN